MTLTVLELPTKLKRNLRTSFLGPCLATTSNQHTNFGIAIYNKLPQVDITESSFNQTKRIRRFNFLKYVTILNF